MPEPKTRQRIIVASQNPVKIRATLRGFQCMFPGNVFDLDTVTVSSGVGDQPFSSEETLRGALQRARRTAERMPDADFWVGIEGGVEETTDGMVAFAWIVVQSTRLVGKARTGTFFLPDRVACLIREGMELGEADDRVFGTENSKQEAGAVGLLTGDVIDRAGLYEHALVLALVPFRNRALYAPRSPS
jgi:inosine/xanthosine triphosphatase